MLQAPHAAGLREQLAVVLRGESAPSALIEVDAVAAGAGNARNPRLSDSVLGTLLGDLLAL